jgi:hypothetical protein
MACLCHAYAGYKAVGDTACIEVLPSACPRLAVATLAWESRPGIGTDDDWQTVANSI